MKIFLRVTALLSLVVGSVLFDLCASEKNTNPFLQPNKTNPVQNLFMIEAPKNPPPLFPLASDSLNNPPNYSPFSVRKSSLEIKIDELEMAYGKQKSLIETQANVIGTLLQKQLKSEETIKELLARFDDFEKKQSITICSAAASEEYTADRIYNMQQEIDALKKNEGGIEKSILDTKERIGSVEEGLYRIEERIDYLENPLGGSELSDSENYDDFVEDYNSALKVSKKAIKAPEYNSKDLTEDLKNLFVGVDEAPKIEEEQTQAVKMESLENKNEKPQETVEILLEETFEKPLEAEKQLTQKENNGGLSGFLGFLGFK